MSLTDLKIGANLLPIPPIRSAPQGLSSSKEWWITSGIVLTPHRLDPLSLPLVSAFTSSSLFISFLSRLPLSLIPIPLQLRVGGK